MSVAKSSTSSTAVDAEKVAFIEAALKNGVLLFGEFTLKSGRSVTSPLPYHRISFSEAKTDNLDYHHTSLMQVYYTLPPYSSLHPRHFPKS
jgi:hypothetical protein